MTVGNTEVVIDESTSRALIEKVIRLMDTRCVRLNRSPPNWRALLSPELDDIARGASEVEFEKRVNAALALGGLSHVAFFHETARHVPPRFAINATFCPADTRHGRRWMFEDVHEGGPAHVAGARPGDTLLEVDGAPIRPPTLPTFALGKDVSLTIDGTSGPTRQIRLVLPKANPNGPPMAEPTSVTARMLEGRTGYIRVSFFPGAEGQPFARDLDAALAEVAGCVRLVIDLRGNLGGSMGSLHLMSYLTPDRITVGYSLTRTGEDRHRRLDELPAVDRLPDTTLDSWKMAFRFNVVHRDRSMRLVTEGLGSKPFHGRIVLLVNEHTISAGEMVAAFAAERALATLVGVRTDAQVLGAATFSLGHGFILSLPIAGWYTPRGVLLEGRGVSPNLEVALDPVELRQGSDNQLQAAVEKVNSM
jgi:carboxyl-terminal processing protease